MGEKSMARRVVERFTGSYADSKRPKPKPAPPKKTKPARSGNRHQNKQLKELEEENY